MDQRKSKTHSILTKLKKEVGFDHKPLRNRDYTQLYKEYWTKNGAKRVLAL